MRLIYLCLITLVAISCNQEETQQFSLSGTTHGIENGTILYIDHANQMIDSAMVENNSFVFNTQLSESPLNVVLRTKNFSHYRFLWLENKAMTFEADQTEFRNAKVTGSESENLSSSLSQQIDTLPEEKAQQIEIDFIKNNPKSIVSASILSTYSSTWGKKQTVELFEQFSEENRNSSYGKQIANYIRLNKDPKLGEPFADFTMEDQEGNPIQLSEIKGKITLLEFWASWCGPCRQENPNLVKTYEEYKSKGFEILAVSLDDKKESWLKAIKKDSLTWKHVSDLKGNENEASLIYGINEIPDNFLIDENGEIIGRNLRGEVLNNALQRLLN